MSMPKLGDTTKKDGLSTQFKVVMQDFDEAVFQSCEGLESEIDVTYIPEGGRGDVPRAVRGAPKASRIVFSKGFASGRGGKKSMFEWFLEVSDSSKPLKRQLLTIQLLDAQKVPLRTWRVHGAWPCKWVGPLLAKDSSELVVEYMAFAHEGITN